MGKQEFLSKNPCHVRIDFSVYWREQLFLYLTQTWNPEAWYKAWTDFSPLIDPLWEKGRVFLTIFGNVHLITNKIELWAKWWFKAWRELIKYHKNLTVHSLSDFERKSLYKYGFSNPSYSKWMMLNDVGFSWISYIFSIQFCLSVLFISIKILI